MLNKTESVDKIEILDNGCIQIRKITKILDNGVEISNSYFRYVLSPNDSLANEEPKVIAIAQVVWTNEVITAYKKFIAQQEI